MSSVLRLFIDSTVLIAASLSSTGLARKLLRDGFAGDFELYASPLVLTESERNLTLKNLDALSTYQMLRAGLTNLVTPPLPLVRRAARVVAGKDAPIVAAAVHANANYLVTFDRRHLLERRDLIRSSFGVAVRTPGEVYLGS